MCGDPDCVRLVRQGGRGHAGRREGLQHCGIVCKTDYVIAAALPQYGIVFRVDYFLQQHYGIVRKTDYFLAAAPRYSVQDRLIYCTQWCAMSLV